MRRRHWDKTDNAYLATKLDLRERFVAKVGTDLCFDLYCGTGTFLDAIWARRFADVVCVDKSAKQMEQVRQYDNVTLYCGDNQKLLAGLLVRHGWPDLFDLDAYGYADTLVKRILESQLCDRPFAIIATDGNMKARQNASKTAVPICWGYGHELSFAQYSGGMETVSVAAYTHLREWAAAGQKTVVDFESVRINKVCYWAAHIEPATR